MDFILTLISLVYALALTVHTVVSLARGDRQERCRRLRNFKKGKFAAVFLAFLPLYIIAYRHQQQSALRIALNAFHSTLRSVALSFDMDVLEPIMETGIFYTVTLVLCMTLTVANAVLFSVSLLFRRIFNRYKLRAIRQEKKNVCVLIGYGERGRQTITTIDQTETDVVVLCSQITESVKEELYVLRAAFLSFSEKDDLADTMKKICVSFQKRHCSVILLSDNEEENLSYAYQAAALASSLGKDFCLNENEKIGLDFYLFSNHAQETVYRRITQQSHGIVHCMNRYQMLAMDFVMKHPITQNIPHLIDTEHACLKEGTDYRTILIGFGKFNRHLFRIYTQNNQCMVMKKGVPTLQPLTYHIFDSQCSYENSTFNHSDLRYHHWLKEAKQSEDYFDFPAEPADFTFHQTDINSYRFFAELRSALTVSDRGHNMVVISLGTDTENLDLAEKIAVLAKELGCEKQTEICVRIRSRELSRQIALHAKGEVRLTPFGNDLFPYRYDRIVSPVAESMAMDRHLCYATEEQDPQKTDAMLRREALEKWLFQWEDIQRSSNVLAILSIRMRLHLLGFDCAPKSSSEQDASEEFLAAYTRGNPIVYKKRVANDKELINYDVDYIRPMTPRSILGELEHYRWNAYYIGNGFVPAAKSELLREGKDALMRRRCHINLTTVQGLAEYDLWRTDPKDPEQKKPDIIRYDYQLMDDVIWLLARRNYKIIRRKTQSL